MVYHLLHKYPVNNKKKHSSKIVKKYPSKIVKKYPSKIVKNSIKYISNK